MQIEQIKVEGLFGRFNYDIALRRPEGITIIHAPNGFGKTVLLTMVNAFFSRQFEVFFKYQFTTFSLQFDDHQSVQITRGGQPQLFAEPQRQKDSSVEVSISLTTPGTRFEPFHVKTLSDVLPALNRLLPFLEPAGPFTWFDERSGELVSTTDVIARYGDSLPSDWRKRVEIPDWLKSLVDSTECRLIETQRLLRISRADDNYRVQRRPTSPTRAVVEMEARDLAHRISATLAEYANSSQSLDQSFPRRVIAALDSDDVPSADNVTQHLRDVDEKRSSLIQAGLLDKSGAPEILTQAELRGKQVRLVIGVYLDDMNHKFAKFDQLFERVSLFKEIISEKFQFKSVLISREKGMGVVADDGSIISLTDLSSGEQHELVLLYELLFGVRDDALILIDEPELSLHVGWQVRFLPDLQRIQKLKPLQIILATHSPQIIGENWDLTVELKS